MQYLSGVVRPDLPAMLQPGMGNVPPAGQAWAADNGRYNAPKTYTDDRYLAWLRLRSPHADRCLFATAPDIVGDAPGTLILSAPMYRRIRAAGYRPALVAQDGLETLLEFIPWHDIDVIFLGGSTSWKLGPGARAVAEAAKAHGKWLHMGRVNSLRRLRYAASIGCDSVDGTYIRYRMSTGHRDQTVDGGEEIKGWLRQLAND